MDPSKYSKAIKPICSTILDLPPSCIEFVPGKPEWFVVGTYNLQKDVDTGSQPQSRTGSLILFQIFDHNLTLIHALPTPSAILDLHFYPNTSYFSVASSTGSISIYNFLSKTHQTHVNRIEHVVTHQVFDPSLLILSFTWYPSPAKDRKRSENESENEPETELPLMAVTLSDGSVHLLQFTDWDFTGCKVLNDGQPLNTHGLEAWTCAFSPYLPGEAVTIYSGGDDAKLRLVALESVPNTLNSSVNVTETTTQTAFKGHEAGVTAVLPLPLSKALGTFLLTGSYDDHVRVYSTSPTGTVLAELKIGGGVWRLKLITQVSVSPSDEVRYMILASCMHAGARILEIKGKKDSAEWSIEVLGGVTIHESMCYGSDVQELGGEYGSGRWDEERLCVSTSFYDRLVSVWSFDPKVI